jgi:glycosyltransferase involved in cell wall biosynthesis
MNCKIYIVTPSFNSERTIERTIESVIAQTGDFQLYYHVQDGGSTDSTVDILKEYEEKITADQVNKAEKSLIFSYSSERDSGMYDAIVRGFSCFQIDKSNWMTWLNSDDTFAPDAFSTIAKISQNEICKNVKWVSARTSITDETGKNKNFLLKINSEIIADGLCDGTHWNFIQQEGTFFKYSLWQNLDIKLDFSSLLYAGDWNLWRIFAQHEELFQVDKVLANFHKVEGQLSQVNRGAYLDEIDSLVPSRMRYLQFRKKQSTNQFSYLMDGNGDISINKKSLVHAQEYWKEKYQKKYIKNNFFEHGKTIIAYDNEWQYPAITERFAFEKMLEFTPDSNGSTVYLGFPWATLIDYLHNNRPESRKLMNQLFQLKSRLAHKKVVVTVCQHVLMLKFQYLFDLAGVTNVFWSHAIKGQQNLPEYSAISIRPFPLFPVQAMDADSFENIDDDRKYLFSFVGAKANPWYLTNIRTEIIEGLGKVKDAKIISRDGWHYEKVVYGKQVHKTNANSTELVDKGMSTQFKDILKQSTFTLCPSGSGPNSIRLWESLGYGSVPVILADTYLPPGDLALWEQGVVFCNENKEALSELPSKLLELKADKQYLKTKQSALKKLWALYGPEVFVTDILNFFTNPDIKDNIEQKSIEKVKLDKSLGELLYILGDISGAEKSDVLALSIISRALTQPEILNTELAHNNKIEKFVTSYVDRAAKYSGLLQQIWDRRDGEGAIYS